jgi:capsular polysaccharide biosynthesis protein
MRRYTRTTAIEVDPLAAVASPGILATLRAWLWLIVAVSVLGAVISFVVALNSPPAYVGRVTVLISPPPTDTEISLGDIQVAQALAPTLAELTTTTPLLQRVITATGVGLAPADLAKAITTHVPVGTSLIQISVSQRDPDMAAAVANAIADELREYKVEGQEGPLDLRVVLTVVDPAVRPSQPEGLGVPVRTALGAAIALFLGVSVAFFFENVGRGIRGLGTRFSASPEI